MRRLNKLSQDEINNALKKDAEEEKDKKIQAEIVKF
jgi:hypothetical protein